MKSAGLAFMLSRLDSVRRTMEFAIASLASRHNQPDYLSPGSFELFQRENNSSNPMEKGYNSLHIIGCTSPGMFFIPNFAILTNNNINYNK